MAASTIVDTDIPARLDRLPCGVAERKRWRRWRGR
jgi:hypothetical protein